MRTLAFDSGAEHLGWASIGSEVSAVTGREYPYYHMSGIIEMPRGNQAFQEYRLEMSRTLCYWIPTLIDLTEPEFVVSEIIPPMGFNNSVQSYLANVAITVVHAIVLCRENLPLKQVSAVAVQSQIAVGKKTKKTSKVQVRNGVLELLPELKHRKSEWSRSPWDEVDAIAIGLSSLGFTNKT
jgi:hypothetical protein